MLCWTTVLAPALQLGVKTIETVRELLYEIVRGLADLIVHLLDCVFIATLDSRTQSVLRTPFSPLLFFK